MKIKIILALFLFSVSANAAENANELYEPKIISTCNFPLGKYKYLFSDGAQTYYFSKDHTIYVNPNGDQMVKKGDFKLKGKVSSYERIGDKFIYTNPAGTYTSLNGGPVDYKPSQLASRFVALTPSYKDMFGSYRKEGGKIVFTPSRQLPDLNVTEQNCGLLNIN